MMGKHTLKEMWDGTSDPAPKKKPAAPAGAPGKDAGAEKNSPQASASLTPEQENYVRHLKSHDWYYEYSDDHSVWKRGCTERDRLRLLQKDLDPTGDIWNEHAPENFKLPTQKPIDLLPPMNVKKRRKGSTP